METSAQTPPANAWQSINDMLIQNRCWLCQGVFQKGKVKKVFMVSQILEHFDKRDNEPHSGDDSLSYPPNMQRCYESFQSNGSKIENIAPILREIDMAPWMSGLICTQNPNCSLYFQLISASNVEESLAKIKAEMASKGFSVDSADGCPPGCGCDNPWAFLPNTKT